MIYGSNRLQHAVPLDMPLENPAALVTAYLLR